VLYLLDANVLIDANRDYYPLDRVPEFWEWLEHQGRAGAAAVCREIYDELEAKNDELTRWVKSQEIRDALLLPEEPVPELVSRAVADGYAPDLTDDELEQLGRDPFPGGVRPRRSGIAVRGDDGGLEAPKKAGESPSAGCVPGPWSALYGDLSAPSRTRLQNRLEKRVAW
jgi:hypothetical protein